MVGGERYEHPAGCYRRGIELRLSTYRTKSEAEVREFERDRAQHAFLGFDRNLEANLRVGLGELA